MTSDPLDRWEAAAMATYIHGDGFHVEPEDVLALVAVARAARDVSELCAAWLAHDIGEANMPLAARRRAEMVAGRLDPALARLEEPR